MTDKINNSKRIAKNTLMLYCRMILMMVISLYTSRVIINALGIEDYGIYNVVGGFVTMFSMLSGSLTASIQRYLTYEIGKGNSVRLRTIFSTSINIQLILAALIIIIAETIGLWFLNHKMLIPQERIIAANWCYQFSIITFVINLISIPYNAAIIAHEKMSAFAYISIIDAVGKLIIAYLIAISPIDNLVFYGLMVTILACTIRLIYGRYCKNKFEETDYQVILDRSLLKEMFGFAGWNFIGASSAVLRDQGGNIILNLFFGPSVNAARGIAVKVNSIVHGFVQSFTTALNPQITKSYAIGDYDFMFKLVFQGARFSFFLLLVLSLPVILNAHYILVLWLKIVPEHTVLFIQLILSFAMFESISSPLITSMLATGRIKNYQLIVGGLQMMNLPISYLILKLGGMPEAIVLVAIIIGQCCLWARLFMLRRMINLNVIRYLREVYIKVIVVFVFSFIPLFLLNNYFEEGILNFFIISFFSVLYSSCIILFIGCNKQDRNFIITKTCHYFKKKNGTHK